MENKYILLRTIAVLFEILAWLILVLGLIVAVLFAASTGAINIGALGTRMPLVAIWQLLRLPAVSGFVAAGVTALACILMFLILAAIGELVFLLLDIEAETREVLNYLRPRM